MRGVYHLSALTGKPRRSYQMFATLSRTSLTPDGTKSAFEITPSRASPTRNTPQAMSAGFMRLVWHLAEILVPKKKPQLWPGLRGLS
jgi:hypothetical protein